MKNEKVPVEWKYALHVLISIRVIEKIPAMQWDDNGDNECYRATRK